MYDADSSESPALLPLLHRTPAAGKAGSGGRFPELFQACVCGLGSLPFPSAPQLSQSRGWRPLPWTICIFVQGGWAAFISSVVLEGRFRSSSSPSVLPGSKGARPGDS